MNNKKLFILASFFFMLIGCSSCKKEAEEVVEETSPITWTECGYDNQQHPCDFTLVDQNGKDWNLYENYGKIIVLDFSTEWCGYCQIAAYETQIIQDEYNEDIIYVTILVEDSTGQPPDIEDLERWSDHFGITAPVLAGSRDMLDSSGVEGWMITGWPTFYFIDKEMVIHSAIRGYSPDGILTTIDSMIVENIESSN